MRSAGRGRRGFGTIALCRVNLPLRMFLPIHGASPSSIRRRCLLCPQQFFFLRKCNVLTIKGVCAWFGGTKVYVQEYRYSYVMTIYTLDYTLYILLHRYYIVFTIYLCGIFHGVCTFVCLYCIFTAAAKAFPEGKKKGARRVWELLLRCAPHGLRDVGLIPRWCWWSSRGLPRFSGLSVSCVSIGYLQIRALENIFSSPCEEEHAPKQCFFHSSFRFIKLIKWWLFHMLKTIEEGKRGTTF